MLRISDSKADDFPQENDMRDFNAKGKFPSLVKVLVQRVAVFRESVKNDSA